MAKNSEELETELDSVKQRLLEQEHRTIQIISQMMKPPEDWDEEDKKANKRAFYWSLARLFIPGLGAGSGTGLIAIATLVLLGFQTFTLIRQSETLDEQTDAIVREFNLRVAEAESLRPVLSIVPRSERTQLRLSNDGTKEARIDWVKLDAPGFESENEKVIAGLPPYQIYERTTEGSCKLRIAKLIRDDALLYPISHEGSRASEFLRVQNYCEDELTSVEGWAVSDFRDELSKVNISVCYCMQDRDRCWKMEGNYYALSPDQQLTTESVKRC